MRERLCTENHEWNPRCVLAIHKSNDQRALDTLGLALTINNSKHSCCPGSKCLEYSSNLRTCNTDGKTVTVIHSFIHLFAFCKSIQGLGQPIGY